VSPFLIALIKVCVIFGALLGSAALMTLAERKFSAFMQYRHGPNRVGPWGLFQPVADGLKLFFKEELLPDGANRWVFRLAPAMAAVPAMLTVAVVPFAGQVELFGVDWGPLSVAQVDIGVLLLVAIGGLSVYGVILGGWASNSKYSLLGGLRASAQMISYELTLIMVILAIVAMSGTLNMYGIVTEQQGTFLAFLPDWNVFQQPLAFVLFVIATFAETNRHPFDFAECEPELVGGFHTEYSSMKFGLYFLGEYSAMVVMACLTTTLFLGGGEVPYWAAAPWYLQVACFAAKAGFFLFLFIWVRWTLPRFRFDQLMALGWKCFLPLALANLLVTGLVVSL